LRRDVSANAEVKEFGVLRAQTDFDIAQTFAKRQARERHARVLIEAREGSSG
jgi:hypothetical protein